MGADTASAAESRSTGLSVVGNVQWGTHLCQFYETEKDLLDIVVPFLEHGLDNGEFCLWVVSAPLALEEAADALRQAIPDLDAYLAQHRIEVLSHDAWYVAGGAFDLHRVIAGWNDKLDQALARGHAGMRVVGQTSWLKRKEWHTFREYEQRLGTMIADRPMIVLCAYPLAERGAADILDVARTHKVAIARRHGQWAIVETPELKLAAEEELGREKERLQSIIERSPVMITFTDEDGRIEFVNREYERTTGWTLEELVAQNVDVFTGCDPDPQDHEKARRFVAESRDEWVDFKTTIRVGRVIDTTWAIVRLSDGTRVAIGQDITTRKRTEAAQARLFEQVHASRKQLRNLSRRLLQAQETERRAVARELHDEIGQLLSGVSLMLSSSQHLPPEQAQTRTAEAQSLLRDLFEKVKNLALNLRPAMLEELGLVAALRSLFDRYTRQTQVSVQFEHPGLEERRFAPEVETAVYRIAQEALTNVARHADVREATVRLWTERETLAILVEDHGRGFERATVDTRTSRGLEGMHERVTLLSGSFVVDSTIGVGTRVIAALPVGAAPSERAG